MTDGIQVLVCVTERVVKSAAIRQTIAAQNIRPILSDLRRAMGQKASV